MQPALEEKCKIDFYATCLKERGYKFSYLQ